MNLNCDKCKVDAEPAPLLHFKDVLKEFAPKGHLYTPDEE